MIKKIYKTEDEWKKILTPEQYKIMREAATEAPFSCELTKYKGEGIYYCAACDLPLFKSGVKFESGTGWPSFYEPVSGEHIIENKDNSLGMHRTEVLCARCDSHLGHVFNDGPPPTGKRYCINGLALVFKPAAKTETAYFAAGCFWGIEAAFWKIPGVIDVAVGYAGGTKTDPTYEEVIAGRTGHTETVEIIYNPAVVGYEELLNAFWNMHDPTQLNRQGPDIGTNYRSAIFYTSSEQEKLARLSKEKLEKSGKYEKPVATEIVPAGVFCRAEEYHQRYLEKNRGATCYH